MKAENTQKLFCNLKLKVKSRRSYCGAVEANPTRNREVVGSIPGLTQGVKDLALLWLWHRPAAVALIRLLAWEPSYATGAGLKSKKIKN